MAANTYLTPEERAALESVRVGIAGAGGLGSNCAMHLVRAGVKHLTIVDFDVVNESNLNRQFFFRDQIGQKKVEALKANLLRIEPDADIRAVDMRLDASSAREVFADCGIVVEAFDAVDAKVMLVSAFASSGKKLVTALRVHWLERFDKPIPFEGKAPQNWGRYEYIANTEVPTKTEMPTL